MLGKTELGSLHDQKARCEIREKGKFWESRIKGTGSGRKAPSSMVWGRVKRRGRERVQKRGGEGGQKVDCLVQVLTPKRNKVQPRKANEQERRRIKDIEATREEKQVKV